MTIMDQLADPARWQEFYQYKIDGGHMLIQDETALREFIDGAGYLPVVAAMRAGEDFPLPQVTVLSKKDTAKKRVVFTYPFAENMVLKLMAYLMQQYDGLMAPNLYSFRRNIGVKQAVQRLVNDQEIGELYSYKLDIHDYFNSVNVEKLLPRLKELLTGEENLYEFVEKLLWNPYAVRNGEIVTVKKGIMAGVPISAFLANVYLMEMDHEIERRGILYARYSDDIIFFAKSRELLEVYRQIVFSYLERYDLTVNPTKCVETAPGQAWEYLGFSCCQGKIDISEVARTKIMAKCKRKARAIYRWKRSNGKEDSHAVRAYIKYLNRKFFENPVQNELTWCRWYLPMINTDETLRRLDHYIQQNIRYLTTGRYTKANFDLRYETMQQLGYRSLVGEYYRRKKF